MDIAVLFADLRGSTAMGEHLSPGAYGAMLNKFYNAATEVLVRHDAIVDKLIGDAVMALFIPGICGPRYHLRAAQAVFDLLRATGYDRTGRAWMPIGAAVNSGIAYVGNVGGDNAVDFTALGDPVNTAARLASIAGAGEALLSETVYASAARSSRTSNVAAFTARQGGARRCACPPPRRSLIGHTQRLHRRPQHRRRLQRKRSTCAATC